MNTNRIAHVAALIGEPARTAMLVALMDGRALTAHELAVAGRIGAATASRHLALLVEAGLLRMERQGRHRYHRLASAEVARVLEGIMQLGAAPSPDASRIATGPRDAALRLARTCYDHLAGRIAVAMAQKLETEGGVVLEGETAALTARAGKILAPLGIAIPAMEPGAARRPACRPCLDWGERRMHLAGRFGAMLCAHCVDKGWLLRQEKSRALALTPAGVQAFRGWFGLRQWEAIASGAREDSGAAAPR